MQSPGASSVSTSPALGKAVVFKPIAWNSNRYQSPIGSKGGPKDFVGNHGYGHEEWNGRSDWIWDDWKVFHTEGSGEILEYARQGKLGLIMTVMKGNKFYAVGVACGVFQNDLQQRREIARDLKLHDNGDLLWSLPIVQQKKGGSRAAFDRHWKLNFEWVQWRCSPRLYHWFENPIEIIPNDIIPRTPPRERISVMHGKWQGIRPDQALAAIESGLPVDHAIVEWLSTGRFDFLGNSKGAIASPPKRRSGWSPPPSRDPYVRYLMQREIQVDPLHHLLQSAFVTFLAKQGISRVYENEKYIDVWYADGEIEPVLAEVKPCNASDARFAIRSAMGQLLDYRQRFGSPTRQLIVLGEKPQSQDDIDLALHNGFGIAWQRSRSFEIVWPPRAKR